MPALGNRYDQVINESLAAALRSLGQQVHTTHTPVPSRTLRVLCAEYKFDVVIRVNAGRPQDVELPAGVRHVSWFQDFPHYAEQAQLSALTQDDIVYFLGDARALGLRGDPPCKVSSLFTGVDPAMDVGRNAEGATWDMSLCGYIPPPPDTAEVSAGERLRLQFARMPIRAPVTVARALLGRRRVPLLRRTPGLITSYQSVVEAAYQPLSGDLDIYRVLAGLRKVAKNHYGSLGSERFLGSQDFHYFTVHFPRYLDRIALARSALEVTPNFALYGQGWELHPEFGNCYKGVVSRKADLYRVYRQSVLNLANNTHGLGVHSRVLESMHAGGAVMTHTSPNDVKEGGMKKYFVPGEHYIAYDAQDFCDVAQRWLHDKKTLAVISANAQRLVLEKHTWLHRAHQILADLRGTADGTSARLSGAIA